MSDQEYCDSEYKKYKYLHGDINEENDCVFVDIPVSPLYSAEHLISSVSKLQSKSIK
jgi:hypothetical protein